MSTAAAIEALYATGHWLLERERFSDAAAVFQAMALTSPEDERAWLGLGTCHEGKNQLGIASELYRIGCEIGAPAIRCSIARGRVLRTLGLDDLADELFASAHAAATEAGDDAMAHVALTERSVR